MSVHKATPILAGALAVAIVLTAPTVRAEPRAGLQLRSDTAAGWDRYVRAVEARRAREVRQPGRFLAMDFEGDAAARRRRVLGGELLVEELPAVRSGGRELTVPQALVHHWRGVVFIPGITAHQFAQAIERDGPDVDQADVLAGRILERRPDGTQRVFLKVQRSKVVTVVYNTEHLVTFSRPAPGRATSQSTAVRIAEVENPGRPTEREVAPGDDHGFLWRWNAYWRYQDVGGGVLVECESLSLSRTVPSIVRLVAGPIIASTAREAMEDTLRALRARYGAPTGGL